MTSDPIRWRRYAAWYLSAVLLLVVGAGSINAVVDPEGRLHWVEKPGFNLVKVATPRSRNGKARALRLCSYDTIVVGSSRSEFGLGLKDEPLVSMNTYNAALVAGTMYEIRRVIDYALEHQQLSSIVIGLDLISFSDRFDGRADFYESPLADNVSPAVLFRYLVSMQTLSQSWSTWRSNRSSTAALCSDRGQDFNLSSGESSRLAVDTILKRYIDNYDDIVVGDQHLADFALAIDRLAASDIEIYTFISPMHATHLELLRELGKLEQYDHWKREIVQIVENANRQVGREQVRLLDFSGYNKVTTEKVPDLADINPMTWYIDSSHYKKNVGQSILRELFGIVSDIDTLELAGTKLSTENIEQHFVDERIASDIYRAANPDEIAHLQELLSDRESAN